jgi:glycosyltransferase involved in cell wall biosynthesis
MGAHAAWWAEQQQPRRRGGLSRLGATLARWLTRPRRLLVVADFEPSLTQLHQRFGGLPGFLALPCPPEQPLPQVQTGLAATGVNPIELGSLADAAHAAGVRTIAFWLPWDHLRGQTLLRCWRQGFRWTWVQTGPGGWLLPTLLVAGWRAALSWRQRRGHAGPKWTDAEAEAAFARLPARPKTPNSLMTVGHFLRTWTFGGVERQVALLTDLQQQTGLAPRVLLQTAPPGWAEGRLPFLAHAVAARPIAMRTEAELTERWRARGLDDFPWHRLPADLRLMALDLAGELLLRPVDVLHCWIDEANVVGWLAGRLAGVRRIVMTVLGVSPEHWPLGDRPWLRACYRWAVRDPGTRLVAISEAGRADYAAWLQVPAERIDVVRIGFPTPAPISVQQVEAFRAAQGLRPGQPVVIGVFRLDPEKRPLVFLEVIDRVRREVPQLRVFLAGGGSQADAVRVRLRELGLEETVTMLGQPADVLTPMAASDLFLMVSQVEGTPNVSLEAQALGCVPVLTDVGGCRETMVPGTTGLVVDRDDLDGLAAAVVGLLREPERRQAMAAAGRRFVTEAFAPDRFAGRFHALYQQLDQE